MRIDHIWFVTKPWASPAPPAQGGPVMALLGVGRVWWFILWLYGATILSHLQSSGVQHTR